MSQEIVLHGVAASDLSSYQYRLVQLTSTGFDLATDSEHAIVGVLQNKPTAGAQCMVMVVGESIVLSGYAGAMATGTRITSDSSGKAIPATYDVQYCSGYMTKAASAQNTYGRVMLTGGATPGLIDDEVTSAVLTAADLYATYVTIDTTGAEGIGFTYTVAANDVTVKLTTTDIHSETASAETSYAAGTTYYEYSPLNGQMSSIKVEYKNTVGGSVGTIEIGYLQRGKRVA